ncbi:hypothetical protein ALCH109712_02400 [Alkalicoccus chagannorensis]
MRVVGAGAGFGRSLAALGHNRQQLSRLRRSLVTIPANRSGPLILDTFCLMLFHSAFFFFAYTRISSGTNCPFVLAS